MPVSDKAVQPSVLGFRGDEGALFEVINQIGKQLVQKDALIQGTYTVNPHNTFIDQEPWKKKYYPIAQNLNGIAKQNGESTRALSSAFVVFALKDTFLASEIADFMGYFNDVFIQVERDNPVLVIRGTNPVIKQHLLLENILDEEDEELRILEFAAKSDALEHSVG